MVNKFLKSRALSLLIIFISMAMIYYGHSNGETKVVLNKAIRICMECIGIGEGEWDKTDVCSHCIFSVQCVKEGEQL